MKRALTKPAVFSVATALLASALGAAAKADVSISKEQNQSTQEKTHQAKWINFLANAEFKMDLRLLSAELFGGMGLRGGYMLEVDDTFYKGLKVRKDRFYLRPELNADDLITAVSGIDFGIGASARGAFSVDFYRIYRPDDKVQLAPYFAKQFPLDTRRTITGLKPSDMVTLKGNLTFVTSVNMLRLLGGSVAMLAKLSPYGAMSTEFRVHILRLPEQKVRLKLVALRGKEYGVDGKVGVTKNLSIFGATLADKTVTRLLDLNPIKLNVSKGKKELFMVDYVLDLSDSEVAQAYDQILKTSREPQIFKSLYPGYTTDEVAKQMVLNIAPLEDLYLQDVKSQKQGRIVRNFKGSAEANVEKSSLGFGIKEIFDKRSNTYAKTKVTVIGDLGKTESGGKIFGLADPESQQYFRLDSHETSESKGLFSFLAGESRDKSMNALFTTEAEFKSPRLVQMVIENNFTDKIFRPSEYQELITRLKLLMPSQIIDQIDLSKLNGDEYQTGMGLRTQLIFSPEALNAVTGKTKEDLKELFAQYIEGIPRYYLSMTEPGEKPNREAYDYDLTDISEKLAVVFNRAVDKNVRADTFMSLRKNLLFRAVGTGFITRLMPQDQLDKLIRFDLEMNVDGGRDITYSYGQVKESPAFKRILIISRTLTDDSLDFRLEAETLGHSLLFNNN